MSAVPPPYVRQATFTSFQTADAPTAGVDLEAEFNKLKQVSDASQERLAEIQRDDGRLANKSVHPDSLSSAVRAIITTGGGDIRGNWVTATNYVVHDVASHAGVTYLAVTSHTASASFAIDLELGRWIAINGDGTQLITNFGVINDGATDISAALAAAINERTTGGALRFPPGDYYLVGNIDVTLTSPLAMIMDPGARIVGDTDDVPMLTIRGGTSRHALAVFGGHFDNGDRTYNPATQSGTALDLIGIDNWYVAGCTFGRKDRDWPDNFGDSGITATMCQRGTVVGCVFYGQPDIGIYATGGPSSGSSDDYGDTTIVGNHFYRCKIGVSAKRQLQRTIVANNSFFECYDGVTIFEASTVPPGRAGVISGNTFKQTQDKAVRIHGAGSFVVSGNVIEDFGFDRSLASVSGLGIMLNGPSNCVVANNILRYSAWVSDANHTAIDVREATIDAIVYTPQNNHIADNLIQGVNKGIVETSAGVNHYADNDILGATTAMSGINTGARAGYWDGTTFRSLIAGTAYPEDGTYTPTPTNQTNVSASTAYASQYSRAGKTVTVSGKVDITCTANSTVTELRLSLPIPATFTADEQLAGTASPGDVVAAGASGGYCRGEVSGSTCRIRFLSGTGATSSRTWFYHFTYRIP